MSNAEIAASILEEHGERGTQWSVWKEASRSSDVMHYGKKGMRWGVRRRKPNATTTTYVKPATQLSDQDLARRIKRLEQEKKYNKLNQKEMSKGKKAVDEILTNSGKKAISTGLAAATVAAGAAAVSLYLVATKVVTH